MKFFRWTFFFVLTVGLIGCSSLFYYPNKDRKYIDPSRVQLTPENIYFPSFENKKLHGWWIESKTKPSKGTIVFFHGNAENLTSHFMQLSWLPQHGYNYFIFDYPGFGESEGKANIANVVRSGFDAIRWVHKNKDSSPLIIYGQSAGGIAALRAALELKKEIPIRLIIHDSSFYSYQKIARYKLSTTWLTWVFQPLAYVLISDEWAPKNFKDIAPTPILLIHGQKDTIVEPHWSEELFQQLDEPKEIWRVENSQHIQTYWRENGIYRQRLLEYFEKHP